MKLISGEFKNMTNSLIISLMTICVCIYIVFKNNSNINKANKTSEEYCKKEILLLRTLLTKQKDYISNFCSDLVQQVMEELRNRGMEITYLEAKYVIDRVEIEWLKWIMVNHISSDANYISNKSEQMEHIVNKAVAKIRGELIKSSDFEKYCNTMCFSKTKELIQGLLKIKMSGISD